MCFKENFSRNVLATALSKNNILLLYLFEVRYHGTDLQYSATSENLQVVRQ